MRRVIVSMNLTLDGFISGPDGSLDWHFPLWTDEMNQCAKDQLRTMDTILVGRITYQNMAAYWPSAPPGEFGDMMNAYTKMVFSTTLQKTEWKNSVLVKEELVEKVSGMKTGQGKDMIVYGSRSIVNILMRKGLVDEYRIWIHPVFIGTGKALFPGLRGHLACKLIRSRVFRSGVVLHHYRPAAREIPDCTSIPPEHSALDHRCVYLI